MARTLVALALAAAVAASGGGAARGGGSPVALVTAETENALLAVSLPSGHVLKRLTMPADPENVAVVGRWAVVVSPRAGAATVVSLPSLRVVRVLRGLVSPHLAAPTADGLGAYVTDDGSGRLVVIRLSARPRVVGRVYVGAEAHHLSVSPAGNQLWIALGERARTIVALDVSNPWRPRVVGRFDPGFAAHDVAFSSESRVWVTASDRRFVTIFDSRTRRPVARVPAGAPPQHVAFGVRQAFVTSGYGSSLELVDRTSGRVRRTVRVPYGSFNVASFGSFVVTSSLLRGTVTELTDRGNVWMSRRVAPAARGVAVAVFPSA